MPELENKLAAPEGCAPLTCSACSNWEPRQNSGMGDGYCPIFDKFTDPDHGEKCTAFSDQPQNCPNCENVGWYMVPDSKGQPTMEQCQWCYTVANSVFNSLPNADVDASPPLTPQDYAKR